MRSFLIAMALVVVCGCKPYLNLQHPIYLVTEKSFWSGCDKDQKGEKACHEFRVQRVYAGIAQWFSFFKTASVRPQAVIVFSEKELPPNLYNRVIHLEVDKNGCDKGKGACYKYFFFLSLEMVFANPEEIASPNVPAHEFGHGLEMDHLPKGSVMSPDHEVAVTPADFKKMCALHPECRMVKKEAKK